MRKHTFEIGEYYHIYNRGTDKRDIISDESDLERFIQSLVEFNSTEPIFSIYQHQFNKKLSSSTTKSDALVSMVAHCINPNHFHLILTPLVEKGIEKFMQRVGGYTRYYNEKYQRSGVLFQGRFKSKHIESDRYLLHLSAYINMNNRDEFGNIFSKLSSSSFDDYMANRTTLLCNPSIVLDQFNSTEEYKKFVRSSWEYTCQRKKELKIVELGIDLGGFIPEN